MGLLPRSTAGRWMNMASPKPPPPYQHLLHIPDGATAGSSRHVAETSNISSPSATERWLRQQQLSLELPKGSTFLEPVGVVENVNRMDLDMRQGRLHQITT